MIDQLLLSDLSSKVKACLARIAAAQRCFDTAALLFRRQGYAATGVNQILETADVKAGSLYHHFPDGKQELAAAVVDSVGAAYRAAAARTARQRTRRSPTSSTAGST